MTHKSNRVFDVLKEAVAILNEAPDLWKKTCEDMKYLDLEISDIMHELELEDFSKKKGYDLACEIKDIRQRRRIVKDDQSIFAFLREFCEKNATFSKRLEEVVSLMEKEVDARSRRIYSPKVRIDKMKTIYGQNAARDEELITEAPAKTEEMHLSIIEPCVYDFVHQGIT